MDSLTTSQEKQDINENEKSNENPNTDHIENYFAELIQKSRKISHQLNNILTVIITNIQLVNLIDQDEEKQTLLKSIEDSALNAAETILEFQKYIRSLQK